LVVDKISHVLCCLGASTFETGALLVSRSELRALRSVAVKELAAVMCAWVSFDHVVPWIVSLEFSLVVALLGNREPLWG
jgi:hypothetical protein